MYKIFALFIIIGFGALKVSAQTAFSLNEAIDYGIKASNEVKKKNLAISDASQQVKEIKSTGLPKVSASVNYNHFLAVPAQPVEDFLGPAVYGILFAENVIPNRDLGPPRTFNFTLFQPNQLSAGVEASSLLFDAAYFYGLRAAKFYKELVNQEKEVTIQKLKENITKAYLSVLFAEENLAVMQKNMTILDKSLKEAKAMYQNGFAESLDIDRLQLSYDNLSTEIENITQLVKISKNLLKFQMNFPVTEEIVLSEDLDQITLAWDNTTELENGAIDFSNRQEYKLLQLSGQLNDLDYKRTVAGYYPTLRGFINAQGNLYRKNLFDNDETGWIPQSAVGLAMQIPIYDGGEKSAKLQRIKLRNEDTEIEKQNLENAIRLQVTNAYLAYTNASKTLTNRQKSLEVTNAIYNKTLIKFREGIGSSLEVTQAESDLFAAQAAFTDAGYSMLTALLDWKAALGKL